MSAACDTTPKRFVEAVNCAQPLNQLQSDVFLWASIAFGVSVFTIDQLRALHESARALERSANVAPFVAADTYLAIGALEAIERHLPGGFTAYVEAYERKKLVLNARRERTNEFTLLRELQADLGGMLIPNRVTPFLLAIPQPDGSWIRIGLEAIFQQAQSPFEDDQLGRVMRVHLINPKSDKPSVYAAASPLQHAPA
ncbi:MAG: hypothetical protein KDK91_33730 [Gammaproteobacteria bacterium]|nr:hypothetical protein [Gammaproteobacteria bacterium]